MTRSLAEVFLQHFPDLELSFNYPLTEKNYFKIGGRAEVFYSAKSREQAMALAVFCKYNQIKLTVLGGGSNVIIADEGLAGLVLHLGFKELTFLDDKEDKLSLQAEVGIKTSALVARSASKNGTGLEGFIGVPGDLGGAIYNNAHYLGYLIGDYITQVEVFDVKKEELSIFPREKCQFAYEKSIFQSNKDLLIFSAYFDLKKAAPDLIKANLQSAIRERELTQPLSEPSCGCVFQNPPNNDRLKQLFPQFRERDFVPAGFLIDQAGLKGEREGDIQVSEKHAAFMVNLGHGQASQVKTLIDRVQKTVAQKFGVQLKEEVFYLS